MNKGIPIAQPKFSFTTAFDGIADRLVNSVGAAPSFTPSGAIATNQTPKNVYQALWDTGATCSCISQKVADELDLPVIANHSIRGVTGEAVKNVHVVDLFLPSNLLLKNVMVICADIIDCDILIGMNIIAIGDFVVSNFNGRTLFTFRYPSMHGYDFVKNDYVPSV